MNLAEVQTHLLAEVETPEGPLILYGFYCLPQSSFLHLIFYPTNQQQIYLSTECAMIRPTFRPYPHPVLTPRS